MQTDLLELATFHLTGKRPGGDHDETGADDTGALNLHPALFADYMELSKLRHDYPLVLVEGKPGDALVLTLSGIIDRILQDTAPEGVKGEGLRKHVLRLEQEIRTLAAVGDGETLSQLWRRAEEALLSTSDDGEGQSLEQDLRTARGALRVDGTVLDCNGALPVALLSHLWRAEQEAKARRFQLRVGELVLKLAEILKADFMRSDEARSAENLRGSFGTAFETDFDFESMSRILTDASAGDPLPQGRRQRIRTALSVIGSQRFFTLPGGPGGKQSRPQPYGFVFDGCAPALAAFRDRLPGMVELVKAISVAELEIDNRYREPEHDQFFERFDAGTLAPEDFDLFPSYLACVRDGGDDAAEKAALVEVLSSGLPVKVVAQTDDILGGTTVGNGQFLIASKGLQLASMAVGFTSAFVLQSGASHLYQMRARLVRGLTYRGPALFSIYSGSDGNASGVAPYLMAAAAMQSRAFPAFTYDPAAGSDWAARFCVADNPQPFTLWPVRNFSYEGEDLQKLSEDVAFTFIDFAACDKRYARHFAAVPRSKWHEGMIPVTAYLEQETGGAPEHVPYILMVDRNNAVHRVIVEDKLIKAARRCAEMWRSLQELGGFNNSHARNLLDREREVWEQEKQRELDALKARPAQDTGIAGEAPAAAQDGAPVEAAKAEAAEAVEEVSSDEPYIETPRCTTCNECTDINDRMFVYDENKQAYIKDPDAGTYLQMIQATENCQVAIIHPGKPRNPDEANLDELIKRAEPFI